MLEEERIIDGRTASPNEENVDRALRPSLLNEYVGQEAIREQLQIFIAAAKRRGEPLDHLLLFGPPGLGKTTLAHIVAHEMGVNLRQTSGPVLERPGDLAAMLTNLEPHDILFIDEIHRFNKSQQDSLLGAVEQGVITLIGATTENPSFEVNSALLSRSTVYQLQSLKPEESEVLLERALEREFPKLSVTEDARRVMIELSDGDARRLLNAVDVSCTMALERGMTEVDAGFLRKTLPATLRRFDKGGDNYYDQISAMHKSVRGSDPDAALYWMCRMLDGGCDPRYIARRVVRMAIEDISLADPRATQLAVEAAEIYERLGSPEGELAIAQAVVYLACAPKSNAVYNAYNAVRAFVKTDRTRPVPMYLRNAPTKLMKELGYHEGYRYAHDEPGAFAAGEIYMPEGLEGMKWYKPVDRGLEIKIAEKLARLESLNEEARKAGRGRRRGQGR